LVAVVLGGMALAPKLVDRLAYEDGPVEYLSAAFLLVGAVLTAVWAVRLVRRRGILAVVALVLAVVFLLICLEEISWGQRVFGIRSPEFFIEHNMQREMN